MLSIKKEQVKLYISTGFDLTLWNPVAKTFATDLSFSDFIMGVKENFHSKNFSQNIGQHISHS